MVRSTFLLFVALALRSSNPVAAGSCDLGGYVEVNPPCAESQEFCETNCGGAFSESEPDTVFGCTCECESECDFAGYTIPCDAPIVACTSTCDFFPDCGGGGSLVPASSDGGAGGDGGGIGGGSGGSGGGTGGGTGGSGGGIGGGSGGSGGDAVFPGPAVCAWGGPVSTGWCAESQSQCSLCSGTFSGGTCTIVGQTNFGYCALSSSNCELCGGTFTTSDGGSTGGNGGNGGGIGGGGGGGGNGNCGGGGGGILGGGGGGCSPAASPRGSTGMAWSLLGLTMTAMAMVGVVA